MAFHIVEQTDGSTTFQEDALGEGAGEVKVVFKDGAEVGFGQSDNDVEQSFIRLTRADGTDVFITVDAGTTLDVTATKP